MEARDCFIRLADPTEKHKDVINHHRVWDAERFSKLVKAVVDTNKAGKITLNVTVRPSTAGALAVKPSARKAKARAAHRRACN